MTEIKTFDSLSRNNGQKEKEKKKTRMTIAMFLHYTQTQ